MENYLPPEEAEEITMYFSQCLNSEAKSYDESQLKYSKAKIRIAILSFRIHLRNDGLLTKERDASLWALRLCLARVVSTSSHNRLVEYHSKPRSERSVSDNIWYTTHYKALMDVEMDDSLYPGWFTKR